MEGNVQLACSAAWRACSEVSGASITARSERADAGEEELRDTQGGGHDAVAGVIEDRGLGIAAPAVGAPQHLEHALVEAQVAQAPHHLTPLDQEGAVAGHP